MQLDREIFYFLRYNVTDLISRIVLKKEETFMKKVILISIFIWSSPILLFAQEPTQDRSLFQNIQDFFNPNKPKTFYGEGLEIKIKWDSGMKYQVFFTVIPDRLMHYLDSSYEEPYGGAIKILFWDKDGSKLDEESLFLRQECTTEDKILTCRAANNYFDATNYRKISSATISIV